MTMILFSFFSSLSWRCNMHHKSTILASFFPGSCFSWFAVKILFNLGVQMRFFLTEKKEDSCLKFKMKESCLINQEKKNLERITRYLKFLGIQTRFFFSFFKRFLSDLQDKWHVIYLCAHTYIYTDVERYLFIYNYARNVFRIITLEVSNF